MRKLKMALAAALVLVPAGIVLSAFTFALMWFGAFWDSCNIN